MPIYRAQTSGVPAWLIFAAILALPVIEFIAFFWVAGRIGLLGALIVAIATSFAGIAVLRDLGGSLASRLSGIMNGGQPVEGVARDSMMLALGGFMLVLPGFVTDAIGAALILPGFLSRWRNPVSSAPPKRPDPRPRTDPNGKIVDLSEGEWSSLEEDRPR